MPLYEHVFLARQDVSQTQVETLTKEFTEVIEQGQGKVTKTEYWGLKSLTFKIKKNRRAHYTLLNIDAPSEVVTEMERRMGLSTDIIRFLTVKVDDPVLHDGKPISDVAGCRSNPYTWYYKQLLHNETDVTVELMERENFFDGRFVSRNTERINIGKYDTVVINTRWCSGVPTFHYAQTRFKGRDNTGEQVILNMPYARLFAPGTR